MIPTIGLMIGCYIIARSLDMINHSKGGEAPLVVNVMSAIAIIVAALGMFSLFTSGIDALNIISGLME